MVARVSEAPDVSSASELVALLPTIRRVIGSKVGDAALAEDLAQETLVRVLAAADRIEAGLLEPYAIVTARNVVASSWRQQQRGRRSEHRVVDATTSPLVEEQLLESEEHSAVAQAMARLSERERRALLAHEVAGEGTQALAEQLGVTVGAVAAQLHRARARMRVEYLLALEQLDPPSDRCRPVLLSLSVGDRRRQKELDAARHLLVCETCARLSDPLLQRTSAGPVAIRIEIRTDADIVTARQRAREMAGQVGFQRTDLTVIATAVSEIARNIVRFAGQGKILVEALEGPAGLRVTAHDTGPGIADVEQALRDGYSAYQGLGLGLPGARRLMDDFAIVSEVGKGTTVTMVKWRKDDDDPRRIRG